MRNIDKKKSMARIKNSPLEGLSGTLGDMVFRTWNGRTYVYVKSDEPRKESVAQKKNRDKFRLASMKAKEVLVDETSRRHYQIEALRLKLPNAYTAALQDMMHEVMSN
jgi:hypothetical protein